MKRRSRPGTITASGRVDLLSAYNSAMTAGANCGGQSGENGVREPRPDLPNVSLRTQTRYHAVGIISQQSRPTAMPHSPSGGILAI